MSHPVHIPMAGHSGHPEAGTIDYPQGRMDFDERPILVFWESTRA